MVGRKLLRLVGVILTLLLRVEARIFSPGSRKAPDLGGMGPEKGSLREREEEEDKKSFSSHISQQIIDTLPQVKLRIDPLTSLKIRKNFHWLRTTLSVGADYSTQEGTWTTKYSWEDSLIGGKLSLKGSELQLHKNWIFNLGQNSPLCANLRLKAALDLATGQISARFGFRTEQTKANSINIIDGIDLVKNLPLDGTDGHAKLQVKLRVAFPQPDFTLDSTSNNKKAASSPDQGVYFGMGDLELDLNEVNLCLDW